MARHSLTAAAAGLAVVSGCTPDASLDDVDEVFESVLPATAPTVAGPAYVLLPGSGPASVRTSAGVRDLGRCTTRGGPTTGTCSPWAATARTRSTRRRCGAGHTKIGPDSLGVTPEAVTALIGWRRAGITVFDPDLSSARLIHVPDSAMRTDQVDSVEAYRSVGGTPVTLDGVTWVEWLVGSEDEAKDDHGLLRIEGDEIRDVQHNGPEVELHASTDGAALLMLRDSEEPCAGCTAWRDLVELDPRTGAVAASYGMPPGYDGSWRVDAVDKVGDRVAVRFELRSSEELDEDATYSWQTWVYDGAWAPLDGVGATRTWWQDGGRVVETREGPRNNVSGGTPYRLTWVAGGETQTLFTPTRRALPGAGRRGGVLP